MVCKLKIDLHAGFRVRGLGFGASGLEFRV